MRSRARLRPGPRVPRRRDPSGVQPEPAPPRAKTRASPRARKERVLTCPPRPVGPANRTCPPRARHSSSMAWTSSWSLPGISHSLPCTRTRCACRVSCLSPAKSSSRSGRSSLAGGSPPDPGVRLRRLHPTRGRLPHGIGVAHIEPLAGELDHALPPLRAETEEVAAVQGARGLRGGPVGHRGMVGVTPGPGARGSCARPRCGPGGPCRRFRRGERRRVPQRPPPRRPAPS